MTTPRYYSATWTYSAKSTGYYEAPRDDPNAVQFRIHVDAAADGTEYAVLNHEDVALEFTGPDAFRKLQYVKRFIEFALEKIDAREGSAGWLL